MEFKSKKETFSWPPLESDPEIFNNYMYQVGLPTDYFFSELFSLDKEVLSTIETPVLAIIVSYQKAKKEEEGENKEKKLLKPDDVPFYMLQCGELDNACGVIAAIHSIGNNLNTIKLEKNTILEKFYTQGLNKDPKSRSELLEQMNEFKEKHKEFSNEGQSNLCEKQDDVKNHFVSFVFHNNNIIELDGCIGSPVLVKEAIKKEDFLFDSAKEIQKRLENKSITENLNMMFLTKG